MPDSRTHLAPQRAHRSPAASESPCTMLDGFFVQYGINDTASFALAVFDFAVPFWLIYQLLRLIRGTRAVQVLFGLLVVFLLYFVPKSWDFSLPTINWLFDKFIGSFMMVIVVLFQDEIRRGLAKISATRFMTGKSSSEEISLVEELVRAASLLSERQIGALIALEREADLSAFTDEAVRVDSWVTKELLFAIFNPANANPLHDGAVVIRGQRVVAAGCFLPLTSNPSVDKNLGTRHRAGIGLSEDTDTVVLIVSEETGIVSIAYAGRIARDLNPNDLREMLQGFLGSDRDATADAGAVAAEDAA